MIYKMIDFHLWRCADQHLPPRRGLPCGRSGEANTCGDCGALLPSLMNSKYSATVRV
jgi:hypothetical protein